MSRLSLMLPRPALPARALPPVPIIIGAYAAAIAQSFTTEMLARTWCVQATRIAHLVYGHFGIDCVPAIVSLQCFNAQWLKERGEYGGPVPSGQRPAVMRCGASDRDAAVADGDWYGHLVALVGRSAEPRLPIPLGGLGGDAPRTGQWLVDAAALQTEVRRAGLHAPPLLITELTAPFTSYRQVRVRHAVAGTVTDFVYTRREDDPDIYTMEGWTSPANVGIARTIADAMDDVLSVRAHCGGGIQL